jgi:ubiquinone/menaquinone biosynthesis C-methylase UbiE
MEFENVYHDEGRAESYAKLEFPGTYYLAYRDLPEIIADFVHGNKALDFGCGTGRSTRFLRNLGFRTVGIDISDNMIKKARRFDPNGDYRLVTDGSIGEFTETDHDLVLSAFTFDNIPTKSKKIALFRALASVLDRDGIIVNLVSSPDIYVNEWASFTTRDFPENRQAESGDVVRIIMKDVEDRRPVEDIIFTDEAYRDVYRQAGLEVVKMHAPLANESEPYEWINETRIAPWIIYVLKKLT